MDGEDYKVIYYGFFDCDFTYKHSLASIATNPKSNDITEINQINRILATKKGDQTCDTNV